MLRFISNLILCGSILFSNAVFGNELYDYYHLNMRDEAILPTRFRLASDPYTIDVSPVPSRDGLNNLKISGSSQFSESGLKHLIQKIPSDQIIIVDLRQEYHGFVNGHAICWKEGIPSEGHGYNKDKTGIEIEQGEENLLTNLYDGKKVTLDPHHHNQSPLTLSIDRVETERQLANRLGLGYVRFYVQDTNRPTDEEVDRFINFIKTLPPNAWLHFHCAGGLGRTTTFMILYDMMHHADKIDTESFIRRHKALGGQDLFKMPEDPNHPKCTNVKERLKFLYDFHRYCKESDPFSLLWSDFSAKIRDLD